MKTNKKHIVLTWTLLLCFAAGQWAVWSHQHRFQLSMVSRHSQPHTHKTVISENCPLCDAMHYSSMAVFNIVYFAPVTVSSYFYKDAKYRFTSIALILSAGRSPPMA
ncbi:MAG: hypothetical protein ACTHNW_05180 [Mucilaginibacter sp.]